VVDNLCRKPMALITVGWWQHVYAASMACGGRAGRAGKFPCK
jgi:hypothetical protein